METEILQMLNDTLDDYNILRRDNLLAELVINFARVHLRIATDKASKQENNEKQQKINLLMLTFDLDQLNGRIQLSPKEHRTEMSINIGDLSIQQMQQQQFINNFEEKKKDSNDLSKNNNDDSLFCGFQEDILSNSDITTSLLFTIGRRNENKTTKNNFSSPIVELFYKRLAPKMEIYHELNICCAPLAMLADDCFIATLREIVERVEENNKVGEKIRILIEHVFLQILKIRILFKHVFLQILKIRILFKHVFLQILKIRILFKHVFTNF
ncbi:unnamed protein product [Meloidogyne enterolobii]|uniref:Uncharacterized protein n=1 Tax=Meloidogyne enterolobii TaxID=390850 RepID=A0ACB1B317_MELEN